MFLDAICLGVVQNGRSRHREREPHGLSSNGTPKRSKIFDTRYFIIKSLNHHNIAKSIEKGIWATQAMNEPVLNEAFEVLKLVYLHEELLALEVTFFISCEL